ncbi:MAG: glycosyltransferase family 1 protein [Tindallia sp. MSAO_Bac2]|nr:MAG: glycosyltransferase family 1 protein [Tindallia sp. MSAO_Bac2]
MNILHIVNGNDYGGATTQVSALIKAQNQNHRVFVVSIGSGRISTTCNELGIEVKVLNISILQWLKFIRFIRNEFSDRWIIHVHGLKPMLLAALAGLKKQTITTIHSDYRYEYQTQWLKEKIALQIFKRTFSRISYFVTVSEQFKEVIINDGVNPERCTFIPNGLDTSLMDDKKQNPEFLKEAGINPENNLILGLAARIHPVKGIDVVIEAATLLKNEQIMIIVAGTGEKKLVDEYKQRVNELSLSDKIIFIGFTEDIYSFYHSIDVNLLASYSEGLSFSVLEAGYLKKPVVCTDVSGMKDLIDDGIQGVKVPVGDSEAFAAGIKKMAENEDLRKEYGQALYRRIKDNYTSDVMAAKYENIYKKILTEIGA